MKKILLTLMVTCVASVMMAADLPKQGFGLQIGWAQPILRLNNYNYPVSSKDSLGEVTKLNGLKVGLVYDVSLVKGFGSTIGINYTFGAKSTPWQKKSKAQPATYPQIHDKIIYHQMELFVEWQYKFEVAKETYLILSTGPTIQCGIVFNSDRYERNFDGEVTPDPNNSIQRYSIDDPAPSKQDQLLQRFNVTWGVGAGFQYKRYFLRGGYDFGLIHPYKNNQFLQPTSPDEYLYTRGRLDQWSIRLGVYLWYSE